MTINEMNIKIQENMSKASDERTRILYKLKDETSIDRYHRIIKHSNELIRFDSSARINYAKKEEVERMLNASKVLVNRLKRIK